MEYYSDKHIPGNNITGIEPAYANFKLYADLDMTAGNWKPFGFSPNRSENNFYCRTFDGQGHTIRNCWVSGHVESDHYSQYDADLGGIVGWNDTKGKIEYCCMTGNVKNTDKNYGVGGIAGSNDGKIEHVTFYGSRSVEHSQDNDYVGDQDGTLNNYYKTFDQGEYDAASGNDMYRYALMYPYPINITTAGPGSIKFSVEGEENAPGARPDQTVTVTKTSGNAVVSFSIKNDDGNDVSVSGNEASGWTFSMPKSKVEIKAVFANDDGSLPIASTTRQLDDGKTYKVTENVTLNGRLWVIGTVKLILGEGATLNARRGIEVRSGYKSNLTIDGPGTLNINECQDGEAGIGSREMGTLTINGGTINVRGGRHAAGIGGSQDNLEGGTITINGGVVNATGGDEAAGIGGGYNAFGWFDNYGVCDDITINAFHAGFLVDNGGGLPANIVLNFGEETTDIKEVREVKDVKANSWYSLDGRKLDVKPSVKGVYINNGKKIVIK